MVNFTCFNTIQTFLTIFNNYVKKYIDVQKSVANKIEINAKLIGTLWLINGHVYWKENSVVEINYQDTYENY